ncbi:hypothetical protein HZA76_05035 [Candidatus Roizmanbacteria bacterium]|nr:hypothetical protein [Candidatus Roizmanbacteria bacterium]
MKKAQALITLIVFIAIAMVIISATVTMIAVNSEAASTTQQSLLVREAAENGIENALLRLLRDPTYSGETIPDSVNAFNTVVSVTGDDLNKTIVSTATSNNFQRKIKAKITYNDNILKVIFWQDIL